MTCTNCGGYVSIVTYKCEDCGKDYDKENEFK